MKYLHIIGIFQETTPMTPMFLTRYLWSLEGFLPLYLQLVTLPKRAGALKLACSTTSRFTIFLLPILSFLNLQPPSPTSSSAWKGASLSFFITSYPLPSSLLIFISSLEERVKSWQPRKPKSSRLPNQPRHLRLRKMRCHRLRCHPRTEVQVLLRLL